MPDWISGDRGILLWRILKQDYAAILIGVLALALRLVYLAEMERHPFFEIPVAGERGYLTAAQSADVASEAPLYSVLLRVLESVEMSPRVAQASLGALSCIVLSLIGRGVATPGVGNVAALALALYGPAIYYVGVLMPAILACFLGLALLLALLWAAQSENRWRFAWPGVLMALTLYSAPFAVLFVPAVAWSLWRNGFMACLLALVAGVLCTWVLSSVAPAIDFQRFLSFDLEYLTAHGRETMASLDIYQLRDSSVVLAVLVWKWGMAFPFGLVLPIALLGLVLAWGESRGRGIVIHYVVALGVGVLCMGGTSEMRFVLVPSLTLYAVIGMSLVMRMHAARARWLLLGVVTLAVCLNLPVPQADRAAQVSHYRWLGYAYEKLGMVATSIDAYEKAIAGDAYDRDVHLELARIYAGVARRERAIGMYNAIVNGSPEDRDSRRALGDLLMASGRPQEALVHYELLADGDQDMLGRLGDARLLTGQTTGALAAYEKLLTMSPDSSRVRFQMARVYAAADDTDAAEAHFGRLMTEDAWRLKASLEWGMMLGRMGDWGEAADKFSQVLALEPDHHRALLLQGEALYAQARYSAALVPLQRLAEIKSDDWRVYGFLSKSLGRLGRETEAQRAFERYQFLLHREQVDSRVKAEQKALGQMMKEDI